MKLLTLAQARKKAGLTQAQLAERVGMHQPDLSRFESGTKTPHDGLVCHLIESELDAVGKIQWGSAPSQIVQAVIKTIERFADRYPIDTILLTLIRLTRASLRNPKKEADNDRAGCIGSEKED